MACYDEALSYGKNRTQFDRPIAGYQIQQVRLVEMLTEIIADADPDTFSISTAFITWRELSIPGPAMRRVRTRGFVAYGSCDFFEPVEALAGLSFLGEST